MSKPVPTLTDILAISGNSTVYAQLKARLASGSAMAFIGAGASYPLYPLWGQLIGQLAEEPVRHGLASDADKQYWLRNAKSKPLQVASQIRAKLDDPLYHTFLYEAFKDRGGSDGRNYTASHAALMRLNFKAYLTTNYDPGLLEARREVRAGTRDSSFAVWNQSFEINRWASGDKFKSPASAPVLFAHGHFADPQNIVLDSGSFRQAYHSTPYRRLFENLWLQEHLVFVGFSFSDVILAQIADEVLSQTVRQGGSAPRHIAIIGLSESELYTPEMRREYIDLYHAEPLFYPVIESPTGAPDHSALQVLLDSLASGSGAGSATPPSSTAPGSMGHGPGPASTPSNSSPVPSRFVHETTEDEQFTGRGNEFARLNGWAADDGVRLLTITAIGGLGKTSLIGRWLKHEDGGRARNADGIFCWSYYTDRDTANFFTSLTTFGKQALGWGSSHPDATPLVQCLELLEERRLIVVLDGLEVVQESPGSVAYGKVLQFELGEFLHRHCHGQSTSLVVLTSRFPFPDLTPYLGGAMRPLPLPSLAPAHGAALLARLGVHGEESDREGIVRELSGHPLALRIFAQSMPPEFGGDPTRLWNRVFDAAHLSDDRSLEKKMRRLLEFYEAQLPADYRLVLGLVALFRAPVTVVDLAPLWITFLQQPELAALFSILDDLHHRHLVTADPGPGGVWRYACHPILRDHFLNQILSRPALARRAAGLLAGRPGENTAPSLETVNLISTAIDLLLQAKDVHGADALFRTHLHDGNVFRFIFVPHLGVEVGRNFLRDDERRQAIARTFGVRRLSSYICWAALMTDLAGEPETALTLYSQAEKLDREAGDDFNTSIVLTNLGDTRLSLGSLTQALRHFDEALTLASPGDDDRLRRRANVLTWLGFAEFLHGKVASAVERFAQADDTFSSQARTGLPAVHLGELLLRCGELDRAQTLTQTNYASCLRSNPEDLARCLWLLGWVNVLTGEYIEASSCFRSARTTFTNGHAIHDLARVLVTEALCNLRQQQVGLALIGCERALHLAAPRKYRLVQADALNLRARIMLEGTTPNPSRARDDAEAALQLAEACGYAWAERDAVELLAISHQQLGAPEEAAQYQQRADLWDRRLQLPGLGAMKEALQRWGIAPRKERGAFERSGWVERAKEGVGSRLVSPPGLRARSPK